jgi:hypothetical protein
VWFSGSSAESSRSDRSRPLVLDRDRTSSTAESTRRMRARSTPACLAIEQQLPSSVEDQG